MACEMRGFVVRTGIGNPAFGEVPLCSVVEGMRNHWEGEGV